MPIDLNIIPAARLALLDTATLYPGSHDDAGGGPDCKHCARELLHEIVTGKHKDATPPGCTALMAILPGLNDGPWRDDDHRTEVMRPYLRKMLLLDPAKDEQRTYAILDHVWRKVLPDICDALKLDTHGSALRDLAPIIDRKSALAARAARAALDARDALAAFAALDARTARAARAARDALAAFAALDARTARAARAARDARAVLDALDARATVDALDARAALDARGARSESWERGVREVLDIICAVDGDDDSTGITPGSI
jgi:hypothetical protein